MMQCRASSHILMDYLNARLGESDGRRTQEIDKSSPEEIMQPENRILQAPKRSAGLETLHHMEHALPVSKLQ